MATKSNKFSPWWKFLFWGRSQNWWKGVQKIVCQRGFALIGRSRDMSTLEDFKIQVHRNVISSVLFENDCQLFNIFEIISVLRSLNKDYMRNFGGHRNFCLQLGPIKPSHDLYKARKTFSSINHIFVTATSFRSPLFFCEEAAVTQAILPFYINY